MCASTNLSKLLHCVTAPQRVQEQHPSPAYAKCTCVSVALHALSCVWYFPSLCSLPFFCFGQAGPKTKRLATLQPVLANQLIGFCGGQLFRPAQPSPHPSSGIVCSVHHCKPSGPCADSSSWAAAALGQSGLLWCAHPLRADELG